MKRDLTIYLVILLAAVAVQYAVELQWGSQLALGTRPVLPWIIDAVLYAALGASAWTTLRSRSIPLRLACLTLVAVLPHVAFEVTHGSDPAYPYIGLLLIVPDLVWVAIGAGISALFIRRSTNPRTSS